MIVNEDNKKTWVDNPKMAYIAGPYRAKTPYLVEQNIRQAEDVAADCAIEGLHFICPHTMSRFMDGLTSDVYWIAATLNMLQRCDLMLLTVPLDDAMKSEGTRGELRFAVNNGIPVYRSVDDAIAEDFVVPVETINEYLEA